MPEPVITTDVSQTDQFVEQVQATSDRLTDDVNNQFTNVLDRRNFRAATISMQIIDFLTQYPENTPPFVDLILGSLKNGINGDGK